MAARVEWIVERNADGTLLRQFLRDVKQMSKSGLAYVKFSGGEIQINEKKASVRQVVYEGDKVTVVFPPEIRSNSIVPSCETFHILFEDDHYLIINKPANVPTIPSREHRTGTIANRVIGYFIKKDIESTFHAVNRLDRDTTGIVIVAKHRYAHDLLSKQQKSGMLKRSYYAIVHGQIDDESRTIDVPIGRKPDSIIERMVREDGQEAITHFQVVNRWIDTTGVSVQLETGRTHQIRVHFASIGHPLIGDDLYGGKRNSLTRQALHSITTSFFHPFEEKMFTIEAPLPEDMKQYMELQNEKDGANVSKK